MKKNSILEERLREQINQLAAQVARLREVLKTCRDIEGTNSASYDPKEYTDMIDKSISESPPEALLQLKREWIGPTIRFYHALEGNVGKIKHGFPTWLNDELTRVTEILEKDSK